MDIETGYCRKQENIAKKKKSTEIINVYNLFIYQINIIQTIPRYINMFNYFNSVKNVKGLCRLEK